MKRLTVGVLAHVDAGKTTLCEGLLYRAGALRRLGRVDHKDAFLDDQALERDRGITIFSKQALLHLQEADMTLLDTPGHVDFSAEMERTLQVLDYALLVISGPDGVQSHTQTLWRLLERYRIPTFLFINKMDLPNAGEQALLQALRERLNAPFVSFGPAPAETLWENAAMADEALLSEYLDTGELSPASIAEAVARRGLFPCYFGAALKLDGVDALLRGLCAYTQSRAWGADLGARVFKITRDAQGNRLTHCKITGGSLAVRALLSSRPDAPTPWSQKVNQIRLYSGEKFLPLEQALPGMVCALTGLAYTRPGEGLGAEPNAPLPALEPVLTYRVEAPGTDPHTLLARLRLLEEEDPLLRVFWNEPLQELHVQLMGEVQLEILQSLLESRFQLHARFFEGGVLYKETIAAPVEGMGHYEPLRHYAEVRLLLEPGPRGSGLAFASACREDELSRNWQRLILSHLEEKNHLGVLSVSTFTVMRITLIAGRAHLKHTEGGDFREATYRAVRQGLKRAQSILLEPYYAFRLEAPVESLGRAMTDLERMGADFGPPEAAGNLSVLSGSAPVALLRSYPSDVAAYTHGAGRLFCMPDGYRPCHDAAAVIAAMGYDSDSDLSNPADSVFCAHGAGFLVKWDRVGAHMDTESPLAPPKKEPAATAPRPLGLMEDKELLRIFERTYGPIKSDPLRAFRPPAKTAGTAQSAAPSPFEGPEYLLVDGYNILFAWEDLNRLARSDIDAARGRLINILCNYQGFCQCELILVFDAYKVKGNPGSVERVHNISVVYTKEAETADMYIERVTHDISKDRLVRVATSDRMEQLIILGNGAIRLPAAAFREEVDAVEAAVRALLSKNNDPSLTATYRVEQVFPGKSGEKAT